MFSVNNISENVGFVFCVFQVFTAVLHRSVYINFIYFLLILDLPLKGVQNYCLFIDFQKVYAFKTIKLEKIFHPI